MAKKHSIPTVRKIFSMTDGLELASMHLNTRNTEKRKRQTYVAQQKPNGKNVAMKTVYILGEVVNKKTRNEKSHEQHVTMQFE